MRLPSCSPCSTSSIYYKYTNSLFSATCDDRLHVFIIRSILRQLNPLNLCTLETPQSGRTAGSTCLLWPSCHLGNQTDERPDALVTLCSLFPQTPRGAETLKETLKPLALGILFLGTAVHCGLRWGGGGWGWGWSRRVSGAGGWAQCAEVGCACARLCTQWRPSKVCVYVWNTRDIRAFRMFA